jgi:hypothetical protein
MTALVVLFVLIGILVALGAPWWLAIIGAMVIGSL